MMGQNNSPPSTFHLTAVSIWCIVWVMALMFDQPWIAASVILVGGPLLAWLLNRADTSIHKSP